MTKQLSAFVEGLRNCGLLGPEQFDEIAKWADAPNADPQTIAREIVQRDWLTAFQVKMFWKGRGAELFLGQYVLLDRLGEGGMGEVYHAKHRRMERDVALKVIRREKLDSPEAVKRFQREIEAAAKLSHENVVMAYDADQAGDRHFFAMEFVEGTNLAKLVKEKGPLPIAQACDCVRQAALGLQHAHERGMVHRDIKPSNLLLGKSGVVKLLDMGLARLQDPTGELESRITQEGLVIGTPDFLAPEQARNARTADIRSDIYALGCTFYYLLCGHTPYQGGTPTEKLLRHTTDPVPHMTRPDVPPAVEGVVEKMMAKQPEDRFQTPSEIAFALQPYSLAVMPPSGRYARPNLASEPLVSSAKHAAYTGESLESPLAIHRDDSSTDSRFKLPPPSPPRKRVPERTRWNFTIAIIVALAVLAIAAGGIYLAFKKSGRTGTAALDKEFKSPHDMAFVLIPAGSFEMGSPDSEMGRGDDEGPVHTVEITKSFYLGTTEVTFRQFKSVMGRLPNAFKGEPDDLDAPATMVSCGEAENFCKRLNADSKSTKDGWTYRLPTEAEWEYACRAGTKTRFYTGNKLGREQAVFGEAASKHPGKVAQFPANAWGLYDMHGNAAEWVADRYDAKFYAESPTQDPTGPERRAYFVIRGGSVNDPPEQCRSARRQFKYPETALPSLGFRVALAQTPKP
jgi:formylglycine-generating enzyme required for sulfatase activity/tRNA A-37 threonylcarbamoyl transferase component Bud32